MKLLDRIEEILSIFVFMLMLILTFINVIMRNFSASISFTEEITTSFFVLLCMLGTSIAARAHAHLGLSVLTEQLPEKLRSIVALIGNFLGIVFSLVLFVTGVQMVVTEYIAKAISIALQIPQWLYGLFIPVGAFLMMVRFFQAMLDDLKVVRGAKE